MERPAETSDLRYPGPGHVLRYARLALDGRKDGHVEGLMPPLTDLCDQGGAVRLGALSLLIDYAAGMLALQTVQPDWTVTHDMALHLSSTVPVDGELESDTHLIRAGKNNVVSETSVRTPGGDEVARGYVTFTRLPRRDGTPKAQRNGWLVNLTEAGERPRVPLDEAIGFRFSDADADAHGEGLGTYQHFVAFDHQPFIYNSLGAIQGGVIAIALERSASWSAERELGRACRTVDLHLHYLALGRTGPFEARAEVLRRQDGEVVSRVALVDTGDDDRLLALGVGTAQPI